MDYVVFGIGFGATLLVLGLLFRDVGPRARFRRPSQAEGVFHAEELVARFAWSRFCTALGTILALAGAAFIGITAVCMLVRVSDARAGAVMLVSLLLLCVLMAIWTWAFFDRFGSYGILPERDEQKVLTTATADAGVAEDTQPTDADLVATEAAPDAQATGTRMDHSAPLTARTSEDTDVLESPTDGSVASPEETEEQSPVRTPEERLAEADSPVEHESLEAELDTPVNSPHRPRRHGQRQPTSGEAATPTEDEAEQERDASVTKPPSGRGKRPGGDTGT